jgi:hypothetical protein
MKDLACLDLLAKIGRGVDQEPALAVAAHGKRRLGSWRYARLTGTGTAAGLCV